MGSFPSQPLDSVTVANLVDHVADLGNAYGAYAKALEDNGVDGEFLATVSNEDNFKSFLDALRITDFMHRKKFTNEWKKVQAHEERKRKYQEDSPPTVVQLSDSESFVRLSEMTPPPFEKDKTPFLASSSWLTGTRNLLMREVPLKGSSDKPVPMAFVRCSRGGKTRAITELMHLIASDTTENNNRTNSIYVSFSNETPIGEQDFVKSPLQELCDRIGFAARKGDELSSLEWNDFRKKYQVNPQSVGPWLNQEKCILFIDELNLVPVSDDLASFLKRSFLVPEGRCFCFSSHLATTSAALAAFLPNASNREIHLRRLPLIPSLQQTRQTFGDQSMNAREALYYGLIPGLLVEKRKSKVPTLRRQYLLSALVSKMNRLSPGIALERFRLLLEGFITGKPNCFPDQLQELMTADVDAESDEVLLRWIPFHMVRVLDELRTGCAFLPTNVKDCLAAITDNLEGFSRAKEESGDAWEALFVVVTIIRCLSGMFEPHVLPLGSSVGDNCIVNYNKPWNGVGFNHERDPIKFAEAIPRSHEDGVSIYYPGHAQFEAYDVIVSEWKGGLRRLYGYQLKEGSSVTKGFAYEQVFDASYLIRGKATTKSKSIRLYEAIADDRLRVFFGVSGSQWTPNQWRSLEAGNVLAD